MTDQRPPADASYLRGGAAGSNSPAVIRVAVALCLAALAALTLVLLLEARSENRRADLLGRDGVQVSATVTGCLGVASGTGITEASFQCRASFVEGGRRYTELVRGSSTLLATGSTVAAVVIPGQPDSLSTVAAAGSREHRSDWSRYTAGVVSLAVLVVAALALWWRARNSKNQMMRRAIAL